MSSSGEEETNFRPLTEEAAKDAYDSWNMLAARLEMLPDGARQYFERLCAKAQEFDPHEDSQLVLSNHLDEFEIKSKIELGERKPLGWRSKHDYAHVFDWIVGWQRTEGVNLNQALVDYLSVHELTDSEFDAVKKAYHTVRRARVGSADQTMDSMTISQQT